MEFIIKQMDCAYVEFIIKQMDSAYHLPDDSSSFDQCIFIRHRTLIEYGVEDISLSRL